MSTRISPLQPPSLGRYVVYGPIASGGMATIQYGRFVGPGGFSRAVAVKRLHPQYAQDADFLASFLDEARLSARIAHANVVATLDVLALPGEISVVMEYVHGESLAGLLALAQKSGVTVPCKVAVNLVCGVLHGLHAAHETCNELGEPLQIVHRDVSPENILIGRDGIPRLLDFGIAKAKQRCRSTPRGELKGKLSYMSPEQYRGEACDLRADIYGAAVVLWETLTGCALFDGPADAAIVNAVLHGEVLPPSAFVPDLPKALDDILLRGLSRDRDARFASARDMAQALEQEVGVAPQSAVANWVADLAGSLLEQRAEALRQMELRFARGAERERPGVATRRLEAALPGGRAEGQEQDAQVAGELATGASPSGWHAQPRARHLRLAGGIFSLAVAAAWFLGSNPFSTRPHEPDTASLQPPKPLSAAKASAAHPRDPQEPVHVSAEPPATAPTRVEPAQLPEAGPPLEKPARRPARQAPAVEEHTGKSAVPRRPRVTNCTPPYTVDELGIRRWKRECL